MALNINTQNDKFPYLARQICGDIAKAIGYGIDHIYEIDQEFIQFLSEFSIDTLYGGWLDMLGIVIGYPRPYRSKPENTFEFDNTSFVLDGLKHGFSTSTPIIIDGVEYDRNDGGILDNIYQDVTDIPVSDDLYRKYLSAIALLKNTHSLKNIADVLEVFIDSTRYAFEYTSDNGYVNDIVIYLALTSADYREALQNAFNTAFVTPPFINVVVSTNFDDIYTVPEIERIVESIVGSVGWTVTYSIQNKVANFVVTMDSALANKKQEVEDALLEHFAGASDVTVTVVIQE